MEALTPLDNLHLVHMESTQPLLQSDIKTSLAELGRHGVETRFSALCKRGGSRAVAWRLWSQMDGQRRCPICHGRHSQQAVRVGICTASAAAQPAACVAAADAVHGLPSSFKSQWSCAQCGPMSRRHYFRTHRQQECPATTAPSGHAAAATSPRWGDEERDREQFGGGCEPDVGPSWPSRLAEAATHLDDFAVRPAEAPPIQLTSATHQAGATERTGFRFG
jgi:hypothetical protein